jgi:hypothetical protein
MVEVDDLESRLMKIFLVLAAFAYIGLFFFLSSDPFTDAPNHLARAAIMKSLWFDPRSPFQGMFSARHFFMPYMLPDLGLVLLIRMVGFDRAIPVWSTLTMLVLVGGVCFYARQVLATTWAFAAAVLCSWYFATNYLFILGFFSFQWGIAASFFALGALEAWRRNKEYSFGWVVLYIVACVFCYGAHMASFAILAAMVGVVGLIRAGLRHQTWMRSGWEFAPFAVLTAYHLLLVPTHPEVSGGTLTHNTVGDKFGHFIEAMFVRQNYVVDRSILALFWGIIVGAIWFGVRRRTGLGRHWELAAMCGLAAIIYFILPFGLGAISYIDERALPFCFIPLLILSLRVFESSGPGRNQITSLLVACSVLVAVNFGSLASFLPRQNREVAQFREALLMIPPHLAVLPIHTRQKDGNTWPLRHAGSFYTAERSGYTPYLFSGTTGGGPSGYFTDLSSIYRPAQDWYMGEGSPDWDEIARSYDYVAITKPWRAERIDLRRLELYYENSVATVFRVKR